MTESQRRRRRRSRAAIVLLLSSTLTVTSLGGQALAIPGPGMSREQENAQVDLPDLPEATEADGDSTAEKALTLAPEVPVDPYDPKNTTPWTQGTGSADLSTVPAGETVPVSNGLPVALGVPQGTDPAALAGQWTVDLTAPETSQDAGVSGLIMKVTPPATVDPAAQVSLSVDTTAFADLYGPQAADRFGLVLLPECVISSPDTGDCAVEEGVETMAGKDDTESFERLRSSVQVVAPKDAPTRTTAAKNAKSRKILTGSVPVADLLGGETASTVSGASARTAAFSAADTSGSQVIGAMDTGSSVQGDFTASPLLSSGSWSAGSSSGAFTYSYQVQSPETAGGLMPKVALSYSSQSVDGRTSSTNNQASWIGDGWDYNAGSITRTYVNCRQDSKKAGSNNATHKTADLCYGSENATLSLGGTTTELVWDESKGKWFTGNGDGSKIERVKDTSTDPRSGMKDADGEYWVVTTKDGTKYHFGLNKLPGWSDNGTAADDPYTDSVLATPVYGNHAGEPCYKAGDWAHSYCNQAWRWNLDYVEDVHGNAMSLWWKRDSNYYARNFNFKSPVEYHRDGYLSHIYYGQRKDSIFSATAPARIGFEVKERCYDVGAVTCTDTNFKSKNPGDYRIWFDTPADLRCESGKKCWNAGPTFWTRKRLDKITTSAQRRTDTTARQVVDEYQLNQSFAELKTGPNTALWLESIQRTG
ncbi:sugar-binding protein, partial [Streptomyces sp. NPDC048338]